MPGKKLKKRDVERLENTSIATALLGNGYVDVPLTGDAIGDGVNACPLATTTLGDPQGALCELTNTLCFHTATACDPEVGTTGNTGCIPDGSTAGLTGE